MRCNGCKAKRKKGMSLILVFSSLLLCTLFGCMTDDPYIRVQNIRNEHDQAKLAEIALKDGNADARCMAVKNLTDQALIAKIAVEDNDSKVRGAALWKMTDQTLLAKIVEESKNDGTQNTAMIRITDPVLVAKFATENKDKKIRRLAVEKVKDQSLLEKIALSDADWEVRSFAAKKLADKRLLAKIAVEDKDWQVRKAIVETTTDQVLLSKAATEDRNEEVRGAAVTRIDDQSIQAKLAAGDPDPHVRSAAAGKLMDRALLRKIMKEDMDELVCESAYERINELGNFRLLAAVHSNSFSQDRIKKLLSPAVTQEELSASLFVAIKSGKPEICNMLISAGADINSLDGYNNTPLITALKEHQRESALKLIDLKADVSLMNKKNVNALYLAAYDPEMTEALLRSGARIADIKVDDANRDQAALSYQWLAYFMEGEINKGLLSPALKSDLISAFEIASRHFDSCADYYGSKANWEAAKVVGLTAAVVVLNVASRMAAQQQAQQMARDDAFRSAAGGGSGHGVGYATYNVYYPGDSIWNGAGTNRQKEDAAKELALKCRKKADCYSKMTSRQGSCPDN